MDYNVSKAALDMVTKLFALELGPHQIRVNAVNPTWVLVDRVKEEMNIYPEIFTATKSIIPMGRFCELREAVAPIMYLLSEILAWWLVQHIWLTVEWCHILLSK